MLAIKTEGLSKSYWLDNHTNPSAGRMQKWALQDVSIEIASGDSVAIVGKNGSGKSTLLKILSRIVHPTKGCFYMQGKLVALLEVGVGFHPDLTGRENIFLKGSLLGVSHKEIKMQMDAIIAFAAVEEYIDTPVKRYSSGMYMRLGFAIATHIPGDILVVDEALAVGDVSFQQKCFRKINELRRQNGTTVLMVSHSMESIQTLCNKAILLENGRVTAMDTALSIANLYNRQSIEVATSILRESKNKYGNGKATVEAVIFKDKNGNSVQEISAGAALSIVFNLAKSEEIDFSDIVLGCAFGLSIGQYLIVWSSAEVDSFPQGERFTLNIDSLNLRPGIYYFSYRIGIGNLESENIADALENGFLITIKDDTNLLLPFASCIGNGHFS